MDSWYKRLLIDLYCRKKTLMTLRWYINCNVGLQLNDFYSCKNYDVVRKQNVWTTALLYSYAVPHKIFLVHRFTIEIWRPACLNNIMRPTRCDHQSHVASSW